MASFEEKSDQKTKELPETDGELLDNLKDPKSEAFPIVCIGGSAGSFHALEKFFTHMPKNEGICFIIIMHLGPHHLGNVTEIIQHFSPMKVIEAKDGEQVKPDHVYVIPPDTDMGIHNRILLLMRPSKPNGFSLPIDYFLQSLAEDQWSRAVAIILSGMGSDGETGVRMIKEKLGMVMVQDPEMAQYSSMPKSAITTNMVDYVLAPEEMPLKLIQYLNHPFITNEASEQLKNDSRDDNSIQKILMLLRSHNGHDFTLYKRNTITRRVDRRLAFHQLMDYNHYITYLRENPHEIDVLFNELLIGVTKFFRDNNAFDALKERLDYVLDQKPEDEPIRIWAAGCSTGEEAYSIAMLLMEHVAKRNSKRPPKMQIFATDLDLDAIDHARAGSYIDNIVADVSADRIQKFFTRKDNRLIVKKELREIIVFAQHNLIKDAPFTKLDLLVCRNLMIYLTAELQKRLIPIFHYSLHRKGILFIGPAETVSGFSDMFHPLEPKWKLFERKDGVFETGRLDFPFHVSKKQGMPFRIDELLKPVKKKSLADTFSSILLEHYTPTSILVNEKGDILYINGKTGKFLELISGEAVMNIHQMAKEELKYALGNAIHHVRTQKMTYLINDIKIKEEAQVRTVNIEVSPIEEAALQGLLLIVFYDLGLMTKKGRKRGETRNTQPSGMVEEMEKELIYSKMQWHTTIEQMETSVEELKSTNEELQSTNEELQSTNEELQSTNEESLTTKEEMQSLNEELMTINLQYQNKAEELTQLNNDMKNLLDNTEIGTIFLDMQLIILRFSPQVKKLFSIISTDVGRSITDIVFNFDYPHLDADIRDVIETLTLKEKEIQSKNNQWYSLRIMPYRTIDNFINGAVLTFSKITHAKLLESKLEVLQNYQQTLLSLIKDPALYLNKTMQVESVNEAYLQAFETNLEEMKGKAFVALVHEFWKTTKLDALLKECLEKVATVEVELNVSESQRKWRVTSNPCIEKESGECLMVLIVLEEIN